MNRDTIETALEPYGLKLRGVASITVEDRENFAFNANIKSVALVGNIGSSYWPVFSHSHEYQDGEPNPLDRWSLRIAEAVAPTLKATAVFPFQGPPYLPFQQWAKRAENLQQSPLGLLIHPEYGLWHSYRFALLLTTEVEWIADNRESPCLSCEKKPCLNTCPVQAITSDGYDVPACAKYLKESPKADCFEHGCMARFSCPVGRKYRYLDEQSQFHLRAFVGAR